MTPKVAAGTGCERARVGGGEMGANVSYQTLVIVTLLMLLAAGIVLFFLNRQLDRVTQKEIEKELRWIAEHGGIEKCD